MFLFNAKVSLIFCNRVVWLQKRLNRFGKQSVQMRHIKTEG